MMKTILLVTVVMLFAACSDTSGSTAGGGGAGGGGGGAGGAASCPNDIPASCPDPAPGWAKDVAPVIEMKCAICHAQGGVAADKPLTDHAEVFSRKGAVLNQIHACKMPQAGSTPLTPEERVAIEGWLVCGALDD
jgi:hypothetical protein